MALVIGKLQRSGNTMDTSDPRQLKWSDEYAGGLLFLFFTRPGYNGLIRLLARY